MLPSRLRASVRISVERMVSLGLEVVKGSIQLQPPEVQNVIRPKTAPPRMPCQNSMSTNENVDPQRPPIPLEVRPLQRHERHHPVPKNDVDVTKIPIPSFLTVK